MKRIMVLHGVTFDADGRQCIVVTEEEAEKMLAEAKACVRGFAETKPPEERITNGHG